MADGQITLDGGSPQLYEAGVTVAHTSDDSGMPDVGISVGLGGGRMLYAGERPGKDGWAIAIYPESGEAIDIADGIDPDAGLSLVTNVSKAIARRQG